MHIEVTSEFIKEFEALITNELAKNNIPGFAIAIVQNNQIIYSQGFGARDLDEELPADIDTIFIIGSDTKSFICVSILLLVELGKISLDDPVSKYVPLEVGSTELPITIRHLMSHSSGIPALEGFVGKYYSKLKGVQFPSYAQTIPFTNESDFYRYINGAKEYVTDPPGKRFYYNNLMYDVLGDIIEQASGECLKYYILNVGGTKMNVEFECTDTNQWIHFERNKAKKIREL